MATQKERRAVPRKPAPTVKPPKADSPVTRTATPPDAEQPATEDVRRRIEMNAYFRAKARGFAPGYELQDWLEAEREIKR